MDRFQLITDEAVRIARDYPELTHQEAIAKAKEILQGQGPIYDNGELLKGVK